MSEEKCCNKCVYVQIEEITYPHWRVHPVTGSHSHHLKGDKIYTCLFSPEAKEKQANDFCWQFTEAFAPIQCYRLPYNAISKEILND
jgi:hypothetical protein